MRGRSAGASSSLRPSRRATLSADVAPPGVVKNERNSWNGTEIAAAIQHWALIFGEHSAPPKKSTSRSQRMRWAGEGPVIASPGASPEPRTHREKGIGHEPRRDQDGEDHGRDPFHIRLFRPQSPIRRGHIADLNACALPGCAAPADPTTIRRPRRRSSSARRPSPPPSKQDGQTLPPAVQHHQAASRQASSGSTLKLS